MGFHWKESHRQEFAGPYWKSPTDREAGADDAGHTESGGCSNKLVTARPEAWAITGMKSVDVIIE